MKRILSTAGWLVMAAALTTGTIACSSDDSIGEVQQPQGVKTYTMTVEATKGDEATTRALSIDGTGALNATWAAGETVAVYGVTGEGMTEMESSDPVATLTAQGNGATTTLTGTFDVGYTPTVNAKLRLKFCSPTYTGQEGTLAYIGANCDYATADVTITGVDGGNVTTTAASFANQQAIVKFSLKNKATDAAVAAKWMTVKYASSTYDVTLDDPASDIFVAIPQNSNKAVKLTAFTTDGKVYTYEKTGVTFTKGKYYAITVKMDYNSNAYALPALTADFEAQDGYVLTGTLGGNYKITIADGATVTLRDATVPGRVANDLPTPWAGITCLGDATIILEGENYARGYNDDYPGIQAGPTGKTLTIRGSGSLTATTGLYESPSNPGFIQGASAGIGGGFTMHVGNICIEGGTITASGNEGGAGIGCGQTIHGTASSGDITITGGNVTATGGIKAAGIGSGWNYSGTNTCGNITITSPAKVKATAGTDCPHSIGAGENGTCGTITIGGTNYGTEGITTSPFTWPTP